MQGGVNSKFNANLSIFKPAKLNQNPSWQKAGKNLAVFLKPIEEL